MNMVTVLALPALRDNYIWLLHDGREAVVIDPGDPEPVLACLDQARLALRAILVTHHDPDHIGGIAALRPHLKGPVIAPSSRVIAQPVLTVHDQTELTLLGCTCTVWAVPGHTLDHLAYYWHDVPTLDTPTTLTHTVGHLFCGDTLFSAGCGRLKEGSPTQMWHSLQRLAALPGNTRVCCAHEYTLDNLKFAQAVEPKNHRITQYAAHCQHLRAHGTPTLPSTISTELGINPYLRCTEPEVVEAAQAHGAVGRSPVAVFTALREWKNEFR